LRVGLNVINGVFGPDWPHKPFKPCRTSQNGLHPPHTHTHAHTHVSLLKSQACETAAASLCLQIS